MRYRLLVLDVDGTLLDSRHRLRPRVAAAVRMAADAGLTVSLATGKLLASVAPLLETLDLRGPQIALNGAATVVPGARLPLRYRPLRDDDRQAVITAVRAFERGLLVSQFSLDAIYVDRDQPLLRIFEEYGEGPPLLVPDLLETDLPPAAKVLISGPRPRLAALRAAVTPLLGVRVNITATTEDFLEFFDPAAGKGQALVALRDELDIPQGAVIAIGDGENDAPLLREAGLAVAMANGAEVTRSVAHLVVPSNDEEGVAVFLEDLLAHEQAEA